MTACVLVRSPSGSLLAELRIRVKWSRVIVSDPSVEPKDRTMKSRNNTCTGLRLKLALDYVVRTIVGEKWALKTDQKTRQLHVYAHWAYTPITSALVVESPKGNCEGKGLNPTQLNSSLAEKLKEILRSVALKTRSQAVARITDSTASQQTI